MTALLLHELDIFSDGSIREGGSVAGILPTGMNFVRVLHELELAPNLPHTTPPGRPEVRQLYPENLFVPFGRLWQLKAWDLNPLLTANNMTQVYDDHLWIANNN